MRLFSGPRFRPSASFFLSSRQFQYRETRGEGKKCRRRRREEWKFFSIGARHGRFLPIWARIGPAPQSEPIPASSCAEMLSAVRRTAARSRPHNTRIGGNFNDCLRCSQIGFLRVKEVCGHMRIGCTSKKPMNIIRLITNALQKRQRQQQRRQRREWTGADSAIAIVNIFALIFTLPTTKYLRDNVCWKFSPPAISQRWFHIEPNYTILRSCSLLYLHFFRSSSARDRSSVSVLQTRPEMPNRLIIIYHFACESTVSAARRTVTEKRGERAAESGV